MDRQNWDKNTLLNHPQEVEILEGNKPLIQPIYNSVKFTMTESAPYWDQFVYGRIANPTVKRLENLLAELQGREDCIVVASGIAALTQTFLALLSSGDHILTFRELYKPARVFIKEHLPRFNIGVSILSLKNLNELESTILNNRVKLIHFESPTNPTLEIADIEFILQLARKHNVLVSMDGTFAGPHQHTDFDLDIMIHSLTKFGNGHGDVLAGSIAGKKDLLKKIREMGTFFGACLDPQSAYLIERGLKTYFLRFERQTQTAKEIADFLIQHPKVKNVRYPGLQNHPGYGLAKKQMKHMGALISFEISSDVSESADLFCHKLKLIQLAASLGSTETIICPTKTFFGADLSDSERQEIGINSFSLRLSVGLEGAQDLINDLKQALD